MENKIKCNKCKDGRVGKVQVYQPNGYGLSDWEYEFVECIFCNGTGYVDEPENEENGVTKDYSPKSGVVDTPDYKNDEKSVKEKSFSDNGSETSYTKEEGKLADGQPKYKIGDKFIKYREDEEPRMYKITEIEISSVTNKGFYTVSIEGDKTWFHEGRLDEMQKIESVTDSPKTYSTEDLKNAKLEVLSIIEKWRKGEFAEHLTLEETIGMLREEILNQNDNA